MIEDEAVRLKKIVTAKKSITTSMVQRRISTEEEVKKRDMTIQDLLRSLESE
jgi:hypothetical protein